MPRGPVSLADVDLTLALIVVSALLVVTVVAGVVVQRRQGRARAIHDGDVVDPRPLGAASLGRDATLLQFSTEMCSRCPSVHRMLSSIANDRDGVVHLDVDLTHRPDLAARFHVLQTPTTLVLDRTGVIRTRFGGTPGRAVVELELDQLHEESTHA